MNINTHDRIATTSSPTRRALTLGRALVAASLLAVAPTHADVPTLDRGTIVHVTSANSELLHHVPYNPIDGDTVLDSVDANTTDTKALENAAARMLEGAGGMYANLSALAEGSAPQKALLRAALTARVPLLLEGEGERIKDVLGIGADIAPGGAALAHRVGENRYALVMLGVEGEIRSQTSVDTIGDLPSGTTKQRPTSGTVDVATTSTDPLAVARVATSLLDDPYPLESLAAEAVVKGSDSNPECPVSSCKQWIFISAGVGGSNELSIEWEAKKDKQYPFIDLTFVVTLHDSVNPDIKTLTLYTTGEEGTTPAYFGTGGMYKNRDDFRGYFNEKMEITIDLMSSTSSGVDLGATSPGNTNNKSNVTTSNSFNVGVDSDGANGSYEASWSYSRDIDDWKIENKANPFGGAGSQGRAKWSYRMAASNGGAYSKPKDLVDSWGFDCDMHSLGGIAKNNLQAAVLSTWNASGDYQGTAQFQLMAYQKVRRVETDYYVFACEVTDRWKSITVPRFLYVDYGSVNQ